MHGDSKTNLSNQALRFATIFRREANRTATVQAAVTSCSQYNGRVMSLASAASNSGMEGYDLWAATAFDLFLKKTKQAPSARGMAQVASALTRSPMCEVAFVEVMLSQGRLPWKGKDQYDSMRAQHPWVRPLPKEVRMLQGVSYFEMLSELAPSAKRTRHGGGTCVDPVGLMLVDKPWVTPGDVASDPAYSDVSAVPPANFHGKTIQWDADGLLERVEHEMLVVDAAFDETAEAKLLG